jgi:hypothetical protein
MPCVKGAVPLHGKSQVHGKSQEELMVEKTPIVELTEEQTAMVAGGASSHTDTTTGETKTSNPNSDNGALNVFIDGEKGHFPQH